MSNDQQLYTNFPDQGFLKELAARQRAKVEASQDSLDQLLADSGQILNWVGEYLTDLSLSWTKEEIEIDKLTLTGTNPAWNKVVIEECHRSPQELRQRLSTDAQLGKAFKNGMGQPAPILVRFEDDQYKVLDGMHRTLGAIAVGQTVITAYIAHRTGKPQPVCEPHVVYDFIRAFERGLGGSEEEFVAGLRFLRKAYVNVDRLLTNRFGNSTGVSNEKLQTAINRVLTDMPQ